MERAIDTGRTTTPPTFEELLADGESVPVAGWDSPGSTGGWLETIGAGVQLRSEQLDSESLRAAVDVATSRTARARELRADVRSFGGVMVAADTVERFCV